VTLSRITPQATASHLPPEAPVPLTGGVAGLNPDRERVYRLDPRPPQRIAGWIEGYRSMWRANLDNPFT
jgi:hypothetical protein